MSSIVAPNRLMLPSILFALNFILVIVFSSFYAILVLKPKDLSDNLTKMAYSIPGLKQGKETTQYLAQVISRLAFMGGLFLAFLAFFPFLLGSFFKFNLHSYKFFFFICWVYKGSFYNLNDTYNFFSNI